MKIMTCPICPLEVNSPASKGDWVIIECRRCGRFQLSRSVLADAAQLAYLKDNFRLSAWLRQQTEAGGQPPMLTTECLVRIVRNLPEHDPRTKLDLLLRLVRMRTEKLGAYVTLDMQTDSPLAWIESPDEFELLLSQLEKRGLVERQRIPGTSMTGSRRTVRLTFDGLDQTPKSEQVFVAMPFHPSRESAFVEGIEPAISDAGYRAYRVKDDPSGGKIDELILAEIRRSAFLVADATDQKVNVYYEAGFAEGMGRRVVWIVSRGQMDRGLPFDTQSVQHVVWESPKQLRTELQRVIVHRFGKGRLR